MKTKFRFTVGMRIGALVLFALVSTAALSEFLIQLARQNTYNMREAHLRDVVDVTVSQLERLEDAVQNGDLTAEDARETGITLVNAARYEGGNYLFAFTQDLTLLAHGRDPSRRGNDQSGFRDPNGVAVYVELERVATQDGGGIVR